ncbi:tRNA 2-thiouridine(34) synthase MnmA [bacterium]|nr:tRNA 2-thiouridine(34) synthase MnmA [bacterium]
MKNEQTVFVGLSGGVDSSVAAVRLLKQGYNVVGVFIKVWQPDFITCNWEEERLSAMKVAAKLDIPFLTFDAEDAYKKKVADYFIREYSAGRTPNPDVMCNHYVKFGVFLDFALAKGADYISTGHYVQRKNDQLHRGVDAEKDQSYFLWSLSQKQLSHSLFPIGDSVKSDIRKEAEEAGLLTAEKKDSQGICFLGQVDIFDFLSHFIELTEGDVVNEQGMTVGTHKGALVYTIGQRHGFCIDGESNNGKSHFVIGKDVTKNTITVSPEEPVLETGRKLLLTKTVWRQPLRPDESYELQYRYRQRPVPVMAADVSDGNTTLSIATETSLPAIGQSAVVYRGTHCLGGGIIDKCQS